MINVHNNNNKFKMLTFLLMKVLTFKNYYNIIALLLS